MKILIVGASGFLGRKLFNDLLADKHDVVGSSRTKRGFLKLDITDHENLKLVLEQGNFDTAINLAAVGVTAGTGNEQEMVQVNSDAAIDFARILSNLQNPPTLIHIASSTEPIGNVQPESPYSKSKAEGTAAVVAVLSQTQIPLKVLRIHNTYGPMQPEGRFVMSLINKFRNNEEVHLNYPDRVRDFCLIDDVSQHIVKLVTQKHTGISHNEIGTGTGVTLINAANMICKTVGAPESLITSNSSEVLDLNSIQVADNLLTGFCKCETTLQVGLNILVGSLS